MRQATLSCLSLHFTKKRYAANSSLAAYLVREYEKSLYSLFLLCTSFSVVRILRTLLISPTYNYIVCFHCDIIMFKWCSNGEND